MRQDLSTRSKATGSNSTVKRVKRGWRLPANYCFCARSYRAAVRFARESSGTVLQTAPGFVPLAGVFREELLSLALNINATTVLSDLPR